MPRRSLLSASERASLLALPEHPDDLIRHYSLSEPDLSLVRQRRGDANRLGFAIQLCLLRYPGYAPLRADEVPAEVVDWIARQVHVDPASWPRYSERAETRREHLLELRAYLRLTPFGLSDFRRLVHELTELALQTDKGLVLAGQALESLRQQQVILPPLPVIERAGAEGLTRATRRIHQALTAPLTAIHRQRLEALLALKPDSHVTWLSWLRQSPLKPSSRHLLEHIERPKVYQALDLPPGVATQVHQNRLLKMAR